MSWTTALTELRDLIADNSTDKPRYRKALIGTIDGSNKVYKTFEKRRLTNFTSPPTGAGVFVDNVAVTVTSDNTTLGEVTLTAAPAINSTVQGTYYIQWFQDSELTNFLTQASQWLGFDAYANIPAGLRPSAKHFAAQEGYYRLSLWWAERLSEVYRLEDAPSDRANDPAAFYKSLAEDAQKKAQSLRNSYYEGKGQELQARSTSIAGNVAKVVPNR